jgi:hypothetical protein
MSDFWLLPKVFDGELVFLKHALPKHFFVKFNGFGVTKDYFDRLVKNNSSIKNVVIIYKGKKTIVYKSKVVDWVENASVFEYGDDVQLILSKAFMKEIFVTGDF